MLKKILAVSLLAVCSTSFAEGTMTERLKASIDPDNVRVVYETYRGVVEQGLTPDRMFTFAKRGKDFYIQKDFALMKPLDLREMAKKAVVMNQGFGIGGLFGLGGPKKSKSATADSQAGTAKPGYTLSDNDVVAFSGSLIRDQYNACIQAQNPSKNPITDLFDLCVGYQDKIYMINRGAQKGSWVRVEDAVPGKLIDESLQILSEFKFSSNALNVLLSRPGEYDLKYVNSCEQVINGENYAGEEFVSQQLNDTGLANAPETRFTLFYKDGKLAYIDEGTNNMGVTGSSNVLGMKFTYKFMTKVISLDKNFDNYVLRSLRHYDIGEQKLKNE